MYRDAQVGPRVRDRDPRSLVEEVGLVEPGEDVTIGRVEHTPTTIAKVRIAYEKNAPDAVEVLVDAPAPVADRLARSQCAPERKLVGSALDELPKGLLRGARELVHAWSRASGRTAKATSVGVRREDVVHIDFCDGAGRRHHAWLGTAPLRLLGDELIPPFRDRAAAAAREAGVWLLAGAAIALAYALTFAVFFLP